jgi:hypothetical protein
MAIIIDLFSRKVRQIGEVAPFLLRTVPGAVTKEDVLAAQDHDFRKDWSVTLASYKKVKLQLKSIKKHNVTLSDIGKAIAIASILKNDEEAVAYFTNLSTVMATTQQFYLELGQIPDNLKGYVWSLNFQVIINAAALAEYQLGSFVGKKIVRHVFF